MLIAQDTAHAIGQAVSRGRLQGITDGKTLRGLGRDAVAVALRVDASHHAGGAISAGRHAAALQAAATPRAEIVGARYTSVLDKASCQVGRGADDGVLRSLDDPGLVRPPNPACLGGDRCRCILVFQLSTELGSGPVAVAALR